jgi:hypothetical protein
VSILGDLVTLGLTFVGYAVWGPAGALIGGLLGSLIFPPPGIKGPRLNELNVQRSTVGAPIPIVYGTFKLAGNVIWSGGLIETKHTDEQGGLFGIGGQKVTTYTYSVDVAIGLCEGEITGIRRIWADSDLIFDNSDPETMEERFARYEGIEFDDLSGYIDELNAMSAQVLGKMEVYLGTETQLPDPTIESYEGAGNVPGFRGLAYIVLREFALEKYGNRIPNFRFEVYSSGIEEDIACTEYSAGVLYPWLEGTADPRNSANTHLYGSVGQYDTFSEALSVAATGAGRPLLSGIYAWKQTAGGGTSSPCYPLTHDERLTLYLAVNSLETENIDCTLSGSSCPAYDANWPVHSLVWVGAGGATGLEFRYLTGESPDDFYPTTAGHWGNLDGCFSPAGAMEHLADIYIEVRRTPLPPDPCANGTPITGTDGAFCTVNGQITRALNWALTAGTYKVLQPYVDTGETGNVTSYPVNPTLPASDPDYSNQAFWEAAYAQALADGEPIDPGLVYGVDYPVVVSSAYVASCTATAVEIACVPMSVIVADICRRAGLRTDTATQIDVSDLTSCVNGYAVGTQMSARDALGPLRAYGLWDCAESGEVLKFIERGHAVVATLTEDELGVHEHGAQAPSVMEVARVQEKDLPRRVRVHFANLEFDHEPSEQSASRITTEAVTENDVALPIAMTPDTAAQLAEIILYSEWVSRSTYQFSVNHDWLALEPTDCLEIPVDGETTRVRITAVDYSLGGVIVIQAQRDDDGSYVSTAIAAPTTPSGSLGGPGTGVVCPSGVVLLDIPRLDDSHVDAGFYAAVYGTCQGWACAELYRSNDGGVTFARVARVDEETTVGEITAITGPPTNPAMPGESPQYDSSDSITVQLFEGELGTITDAQLAAGQNMAAIGVDGRWVIIQFQTAVLTTTDTYELSEIIWGLNDTRHLLNTTVAGDTFVLLSDASLLRIPESPDAIGVAKQYKIVTCGEDIDDVEAFSFTTWGLSYARPCPSNVISATLTDPPTGALDGDSYLLPTDTSLTGEWETHPGEIATWSDETDTWVFCTPAAGTIIHIIPPGESSSAPGGEDVISDGGGSYSPAPWTPAIPPLIEDSGMDPDTAYAVLYTPDGYRKILLADMSGECCTAAETIFTPTSPLEATNVQDAIDELVALVTDSSFGGGGGGALTFVAESVVAGSAATNITISGLDLDADQCYHIQLLIDNATGSNTTINLFFNSDTTTTNYDNESITGNGSTISSTRANTASIGGVNSSATAIMETSLKLRRDFDGRPRSTWTLNRENTTAILHQEFSQMWRTANNVTSITINANVASALSIGSYMRIWKLTT